MIIHRKINEQSVHVDPANHEDAQHIKNLVRTALIKEDSGDLCVGEPGPRSILILFKYNMHLTM
jgi:hypothetical protein